MTYATWKEWETILWEAFNRANDYTRTRWDNLLAIGFASTKSPEEISACINSPIWSAYVKAGKISSERCQRWSDWVTQRPTWDLGIQLPVTTRIV
jgi:hypothetical protein